MHGIVNIIDTDRLIIDIGIIDDNVRCQIPVCSVDCRHSVHQIDVILTDDMDMLAYSQNHQDIGKRIIHNRDCDYGRDGSFVR